MTFVPELGPIPVINESFAAVMLGPVKKLAVIAGLSGEIESAAPESASAIVGRVLNDAVSKSLDTAVFSNAAADSSRPAGLLAGITPVAATAAGASDAALAASDLANLVAAMAAAGVDGTDAVFVMSPGAVIKLRALLAPGLNFSNSLLGSLGVPAKTVIAVNPSGLASGYSGQTETEVSRSGTIHLDTNAQPIVDGGAMSAPVLSAWQSDLLFVKLRAKLSWIAVPGAVQVVQNVNW